ncbi:hypothetical protein ACFRMQ_36515 [Kitasatospora sp. NPDC056783]|uniref:hypothetical protein n=1 Tax=Kitasatospora sp. NPDC056783 TaxID=3345943 RepID=UPI0036BE8C43
MVTARSPLRARRARPRGVAARLFWLGALLAAVFVSHGLGAENGAGHTDPFRIVWSAPAPATADDPHTTHPAHQQDHDEDDEHPGSECLSGKPEDGPGTEAACPAAVAQPARAEAAPATGPVIPADDSPTARPSRLPHRIARLRV